MNVLFISSVILSAVSSTDPNLSTVDLIDDDVVAALIDYNEPRQAEDNDSWTTRQLQDKTVGDKDSKTEFFKAVLKCYDNEKSCSPQNFGQCQPKRAKQHTTNSTIKTKLRDSWRSSFVHWIADSSLADALAEKIAKEKFNVSESAEDETAPSFNDDININKNNINNNDVNKHILYETRDVCAISVPLLADKLLADRCCCSSQQLIALNETTTNQIVCAEYSLCEFICCESTEKICGSECCDGDDICGESIDEVSTATSCCVSLSEPNNKCCPWGTGVNCKTSARCCLGVDSECTPVDRCADIIHKLFNNGRIIRIILIAVAVFISLVLLCCCCC